MVVGAMVLKEAAAIAAVGVEPKIFFLIFPLAAR
jgi:hypothetical protein